MNGLDLTQHWQDTIAAGEEALATSDWLSVCNSVISAYSQVSELDTLHPLTALDELGKESAIKIANHLDPGRCWLWHVLIATELTSLGRHQEASELIDPICNTRPRFPHNARSFLPPLLSELCRIEPALLLRLAAVHINVYGTIQYAGAQSKEQLVREMARLLERSDLLPQWDDYLLKGAAEAGREELIHGIMERFEQTYHYQPSFGREVTRTPESRLIQAKRKLSFYGAPRGEKRLSDAEDPTLDNKTDLDLALEALHKGNETRARECLEKGIKQVKKRRGLKRRKDMCRAIQAYVALGEQDAALKLLENMRSKSPTAKKSTTQANLIAYLAISEIVTGDFNGGLTRLWNAALQYEDHDDAFYIIDEALEAIDRAGHLDAFYRVMPPENDEEDTSFYRNRMVQHIAYRYAAKGRTEKAFRIAESFHEAIDRDRAFELLVIRFLDTDLEAAERAARARSTKWAALRIAEVARAWHKKGNSNEANRIYRHAMKVAADNIQALGQVTEEASQFGYVDGLARALGSNLGNILLEKPEDWERRVQVGLRNGGSWLAGTFPSHPFYGLLDDMPKPASSTWALKIAGFLGRSHRKSPQTPTKTKQPLEDSIEEWQQLAERPWDQIDKLPKLAKAAGGKKAPLLLPRTHELIAHTRKAIQDNMRGRWYRNLSWSLALMEKWQLSLDLACETAEPAERILALELWIAIAPMNEWKSQLERLLQDKPVYGWILGRLGQLDRKARRKALSFIREEYKG
ncbi:MAG: hypothetical protein KTR29_25060 [Rhodothermaceae bacterium]|nr:hypothetical protein [Rhodothermaceae bacterium]